MTRWVGVGRVGRRHGLDGSFVVENASDDPARFAGGARLYVEREPATVEESKRAGGRLVVRLDREVSRGARLELPADELPEPEEGAWYAFQLVGLEVEEEGGRPLGKVVAVEPGIANDVIELSNGDALPAVSECIRSVDLAEGRMVVAQGFASPG
jgi:16S rRNA processing protein RimM